MKELKSPYIFQVHEESNQEKQYKLIGSILVQNGCKLYAFDPTNPNEMNEVKVSSTVVLDMKENAIETKRADYNPNVIYVQAINKKNAAKKILKILAKTL